MIECWVCSKMFEPDPEKVKAWAESGRDFDGTDWECPDCNAFEEEVDAWAYEEPELCLCGEPYGENGNCHNPLCEYSE